MTSKPVWNVNESQGFAWVVQSVFLSKPETNWFWLRTTLLKTLKGMFLFYKKKTNKKKTQYSIFTVKVSSIIVAIWDVNRNLQGYYILGFYTETSSYLQCPLLRVGYIWVWVQICEMTLSVAKDQLLRVSLISYHSFLLLVNVYLLGTNILERHLIRDLKVLL